MSGWAATAGSSGRWPSRSCRRRWTGNPNVVRRFVEEAQLTSQLQHPAIPPVYEMGQLPDGRPFFCMKVVRGRTLASLLEKRSGPDDDLPRLLTIFGHVCQAVAYAHSKSVIHRDLKPANVMVGAFGEVQVMDWGLAKVLTGAAPATETLPALPSRIVRKSLPTTCSFSDTLSPLIAPPSHR